MLFSNNRQTALYSTISVKKPLNIVYISVAWQIVLLSVLLEWKRPDFRSIKSGLLILAPRSRLSAKLFSVPFWLFNDSYQEKHTYNKLYYLQDVKKAINWFKMLNSDIKFFISHISYLYHNHAFAQDTRSSGSGFRSGITIGQVSRGSRHSRR
jgi:hypothetical protein